jgi:hypothetical protein
LRPLKRMLKRTGLLVIVFFQVNFSLNSQTGASVLTTPNYPAVSGEKIMLFTDRNIYCVNERIFFIAEYSCTEELNSLSWSSVLYVELIRWNGARIAQMKLELIKPSTSASMEIPGNVLSGNYYLRSYTKWMRNYSAGDYAYVPVKIVNPFRAETDNGPGSESEQPELSSFNIVKRNLINGIKCETDKKEYRPGEKAEVEIQINSMKPVDSENYCISVIKTGAIDTTAKCIEPVTNNTGKGSPYVEYLPEIRGMTISGEITDISTKLPIKDVEVNLSETQSGEYFANYKTNERGRFVFSLPDMQGKHDFFIQADKPSEIHIDNGYCNQPVKLPYIAFSLNNDEREFVREVFINQQLVERFHPKADTITDSTFKMVKPLVFYGSKKLVYYTDKYIELPDIEEFISEIIMEADIINEKAKPPFINMQRPKYGYYPPLILIDNIRINDSEQLLKTPLSKIEKVEVINTDYEIGSTKYCGIVSFYSRNNDFAGMDLNKNSMFFTFELFSDTDPGCDLSKKSSDSRIPDRRNLLYWNPDIELLPDKKTTISFFTSDCTGDYVVYIRSKNNNDDPGTYGKFYFSVK